MQLLQSRFAKQFTATGGAECGHTRCSVNQLQSIFQLINPFANDRYADTFRCLIDVYASGAQWFVDGIPFGADRRRQRVLAAMWLDQDQVAQKRAPLCDLI
ncbi:hypothetical protein AQ883_23835 [Burkholderia pseudomallei]|nr:hypothetical protein D512_31569 [Burkholderia pseudomallei MSHR1043]OMT49758.1 hypothetical protein AQ760_28860 [Burkholderia pseudomallei]OMZ22830.1 hypothetical protein AQ859_02305 [Burkholderia pseudomallei]OMZ23015.1 hypothetical protein AQ860_30075 [Burkholderia pseudomallei]OMZ43591.1 hypothetical protein AQ863_12205 [Burkholderia pseudomallei]